MASLQVKSKKGIKTFFESDLEMFKELDKTEEKMRLWNKKSFTIEELYSKNNNFIKNLSL